MATARPQKNKKKSNRNPGCPTHAVTDALYSVVATRRPPNLYTRYNIPGIQAFFTASVPTDANPTIVYISYIGGGLYREAVGVFFCQNQEGCFYGKTQLPQTG